MRAISISRLANVLAVAALCLLSTGVGADCVRWTPPPPGTPPDLDGPGSFGELQGTVTLDCLTYVGSIQKNGKEHVLIKDERGKVHSLGVGHYMGENSGIIVSIDADFIYLVQIIPRNLQWDEVVVEFPKRPVER